MIRMNLDRHRLGHDGALVPFQQHRPFSSADNLSARTVVTFLGPKSKPRSPFHENDQWSRVAQRTGAAEMLSNGCEVK